MLQLEVFIGKFFSIDGLATSPISSRKITALFGIIKSPGVLII